MSIIELLLAAAIVQPAPGLAVQKIWTAPEMSGQSDAGKVSIAPDPSRTLIVVDVAATGTSPLSLEVGQLIATGGGVRTAPVGAAPIAPANFDTFFGYGSGWRTFTDAQNREVRMGRDTPNDPIRLVIAPGAVVSIVYIVPRTGPPLDVILPGAGTVALVAR